LGIVQPANWERDLKLRKAMNRPIVNTLIAWLLVAIAISSISYARGDYTDGEFWKNLRAGLHNTLFDLFLIGVLIFWLNRRGEKRLEIQRYQEQLDVWRNVGSPAAIRNNLISIRRLNECGVYDINLKECVLDGIDLTGLNLSHSNLSEAQCFETIFKKTNLSNAILDKANLRKAVFSEANLKGAKLQGADLEYADLGRADLSGADFSGAVTSNVTWNNAIYDDHTKFSSNPDKSLMKRAKVLAAAEQ
jgi:BTB/POZ domain-containing protein KCTD9